MGNPTTEFILVVLCHSIEARLLRRMGWHARFNRIDCIVSVVEIDHSWYTPQHPRVWPARQQAAMQRLNTLSPDSEQRIIVNSHIHIWRRIMNCNIKRFGHFQDTPCDWKSCFKMFQAWSAHHGQILYPYLKTNNEHRENMSSAKLPRLRVTSRGVWTNFSLTPNLLRLSPAGLLSMPLAHCFRQSLMAPLISCN